MHPGTFNHKPHVQHHVKLHLIMALVVMVAEENFSSSSSWFCIS